MARERSKLIITVLVLIIIVLILFITTFLVIKPAIDNYVLQKQIEAKDIVLASMLLQIQQQGYTQISDTQGNSIVLVPLQQQQPVQTLEQPIE